MFGVKIIENELMVEVGKPYQVPRTWRERLFSLPWRPLQATRTIVSKVPSRDVIRMPDGALMMHPAIARELVRARRVSPIVFNTDARLGY